MQRSCSISSEKLNMIALIFLSAIMWIIFAESSILTHILLVWILALYSIYIVKMDIFHPYCWFSFFFCLYATSYAGLYLMGETSNIYGYNAEPLFYHWIALAVVLLVIPIKKANMASEYTRNSLGDIGVICLIQKIIITTLMFSVIFFLNSGYSNKGDIYQESNMIFKFIFSIAYLAIIMFAFILDSSLSNKKSDNRLLLILSFVTVVLFGFSLGERDYAFRIILIAVLTLFVHKKIQRKLILILVPLFMLMLPLSHMFKYTMLTGELSADLDWEQFFVWLLEGEFISAGRNLQILVQNNMCNYFGGHSLLNDFIRIFYDTGFSNQLWFDIRFFDYGHKTQYGFTLVGEGYVNGGVVGIALIYLAVAFLMRHLYLNSFKNNFAMIAYLYMLPLFIYTTRADISNLFSPLIKHVFLSIVLIKILSRVKIRVRGN